MRRYSIGRTEGNDIVLADPTVSRHHAELEELGAGRFRLKDLGSTYGTSILRGDLWEAVTEVELRHDDRLRLGEYESTPMDLVRDLDKTEIRERAQETLASGLSPLTGPPARGGARGISLPPFWLLVGSAAVLLLVLVGVALALILGEEGSGRTDSADAPRREEVRREEFQPPRVAPAPPRPEPRRPPGEGATGPQRFVQACLQQWQRSEQLCQCWVRAAAPHLQPEDYDEMIEILGLILDNRADQARELLAEVAQRKGRGIQVRIVAAARAVDRDCANP